MRYLLAFIALIIILNLYFNKKEDSRHNGELNNDFDKKTEESVPQAAPSEAELHEQKKFKWRLEGWKEEYIGNGTMPKCYNYKPRKASIDNYLEVTVGGGTDVVIKLVNISTGVCARYVFINSGTTYSIKNIPQGHYRLKIAYGKEWFSKNQFGRCEGKFARNAQYEEGQDILNFNTQSTYNGYSIPSFQLKLDVITNVAANSFNSQSISEEQFNQ